MNPTFSDLLRAQGITLPGYEPGRNYSRTCPECSHARKKKNDRCLSVKIDSDSEGAMWFCHHCHWKGGVHTRRDGGMSQNKSTNFQRKTPQTIASKSSQRFFDGISEVSPCFGYAPILQRNHAFSERVTISQRSGMSLEHAEQFAAMEPSVWEQFTTEQLEALRTLHPFGARMIDLAGPSILAESHIGFSGSHTLFWYVDIQGRYVNCKQVRFGPNAFNKIDDSSSPRFVYSERKHNAGQCLYGEEQLSSVPSDRPVILLESEKASALCRYQKPEFVWLATGGINKLTAKTGEVLRGRKDVRVLFDCDEAGRCGRVKAVELLHSIGVNARWVDQFTTFPGHTDDGHDFADEILDRWKDEHGRGR